MRGVLAVAGGEALRPEVGRERVHVEMIVGGDDGGVHDGPPSARRRAWLTIGVALRFVN